MAANDGNSGDEQRAAKKRAPGARKRTPKAVKSAEENGASPTEREVAPQAQPVPADTHASVAGGTDESRNPVQRTPGERPADFTNPNDDDHSFGDRDADRAANVAADLKTWLDTRREDREERGEVL